MIFSFCVCFHFDIRERKESFLPTVERSDHQIAVVKLET